MMQFTKATKKKARLRLAITGPSGSGKTEGALRIATGLGGRIAVIDTEHESASLYSDRFEFDSLSLSAPYTPERYIEAINAAERAGYSVLIIDSMSHVWNGSGGCLEINERIANAKYKGNTWSAWNETTPRYRALIDKILSSGLHVIATMRSKTETVQGEGKKIMKLGMKAETRDGMEYEFTTVIELEHESHSAVASKDRTRLFTGDPRPLSVEVGQMLLSWLENGEEPKPESPVNSKPAIDESTFPSVIQAVRDGKRPIQYIRDKYALTVEQDNELDAIEKEMQQ